MTKKMVMLYIEKVGRDYNTYTEKELSEAIARGAFGNGTKFYVVELPKEAKTLNVAKWSVE